MSPSLSRELPKLLSNALFSPRLDYTRTSISFTFLDDVEPPLQ